MLHRIIQLCEGQIFPADGDTAAAEPSFRPPRMPLRSPQHKNKFFVLYLYAGNRRFGDMRSWAEHFSRQYPFEVELVAVDIIYNAELCNLAKATSRAFWLELRRDSLFLGVLVAPPCQTWSAARWLSVIRNDRGPPPVHSRREPWHQVQLLAPHEAD